MATKKKAAPAGETAAAKELMGGDTGNIGKVRELLFGAQARDFDSRIQRLEERFARDTSALRSELNSRLDSLEEYLKSEFQAASEARSEERREREGEDRQLASEVKRKSESLRKSIELGRDKQKTSEAAQRDSLLQESKKLSAALQRVHLELSTRLEDESRSLRNTLTHRSTLGDLLTEVGLRLKDEFDLPETD
jgi:hypothetical protein